MIIKTCFNLWIIFVSVNEGAKVGQKYKILEKILNTIERRLNHQSNDIFELQESIIELNQSYSENNECPQNELHREEPVTVDEVKEIQEILENERVGTLQNHVESVMTNKIQMFNATVLDILDRLTSDGNTSKMHITKIEEKVSTLEKTVEGIIKQLANYYMTLNNFESKISDEILKIKQELAAEQSCPLNWSQVLGYYYHLYTLQADIDTAIKMCSNSFALFAAIDSEVELHYLKTFIDQPIWVGITDRQAEGDWTLLRNGKQLRFSRCKVNCVAASM